MKIVKPSVKLEWSTPKALKVIEKAGRTCYKSESKITPESSEKFVRGVIKNGHESVLEHACASFRFVVDRGVSHEMVRHRIASFSQESTRYCNYTKDKFNNHIRLIHPKGLTKSQIKRRNQHFMAVQALYELEIAEGIKPQIARGILPNALRTEIVMTCNFREWRKVLSLRTVYAAHPQIVEVMRIVLQWFRKNYPVIVEDLL